MINTIGSSANMAYLLCHWWPFLRSRSTVASNASITVLPDGRTAVAYVAWDGTADQIVLKVGEEMRRVTAFPCAIT